MYLGVNRVRAHDYFLCFLLDIVQISKGGRSINAKSDKRSVSASGYRVWGVTFVHVGDVGVAWS